VFREKNDQKKSHINKEPHHLSSEESPSEILARKELVHEDRDPVYPLDFGKDERRSNDLGSKGKKRRAH
jgi:hypothetical protein